MQESESITGPREFPTTPAGPIDGSNPEPQRAVRLSFKEVYDKLIGFLEQEWRANALSEEDMKQLFEVLLLSYFSRYADRPSKVLQDALEHTGFRNDYFEGHLAEIALAAMDSICQVAKVHFPRFGTGALTDYYRGADLADKLQITDAFLHGRDNVVILMPERVFRQLNHELAADRPSDPA